MVDAEVVRRRLRQIERRMVALREIAVGGREVFLTSVDHQALAERHLQIAIQAAIDVANHIVAEDSAQTPEDYGGTFTLLAELGAIDDDLASRLRSAAGLRNILVHGYLDIDPERLWAQLGHLEDLGRFAEAAERYVATG